MGFELISLVPNYLRYMSTTSPASTDHSNKNSETALSAEDVAALVARDGDPAKLLNEVVHLIQSRLSVDASSIFLLGPDRMSLVLGATVGLDKSGIGSVRLSTREGLVGIAAERLEPIAVNEAAKHPRFKYFPELGEEPFHAFLGVPVIDRGLLQGVLTVQTKEARQFSESEIEALVNVAGQLSAVICEARDLEQFIAPIQQRLWALARNLWWCWDIETVSLFRDIDPVRWRELLHNPIALLNEMPLERLEERVNQLVLHSRISHAYRRLQEYLGNEMTWGSVNAGPLRARPVAYFSAEFGMHESMPIYSGGLGVLAGDHLKSASDLDIPLVAVGLYYDHGYFRQRLDAEGMQQEDYQRGDRSRMPLLPAIDKDGKPIRVCVETRNGILHAQVWQLSVGRRALFLLDSDVEGNTAEDRQLTSRLYGGDGRVRIRQEILLGIGGMRALRAAGVDPGVIHLNEGHSAFAVLEEIRRRMEYEAIGFEEAAQRVAASTVFTTHTPVPAGHDRFDASLIDEHLGAIGDAIGLDLDGLMALGRVRMDDPGESFCMTVLALKHSHQANAVSSLHGEISRSMWQGLWPHSSVNSVPIGHVTNGVHVPTWLAPQMQQLYDRYLGPKWRESLGFPEMWKQIEKVSDAELWETHVALKTRLLDFVRRRSAAEAALRGESEEICSHLKRALSPDALTIGFARRFATYKRAGLVFDDVDRLDELVNNPQRPIQFVLAGKAHPKDQPGKELLQRVFRLSRQPRFLGKIVLIEDYDINVGRHLVQGVDVWLNNPRRPMEASGTSGQKVVLNGGLNLSILDGWWAEAYDGDNGFAIGTTAQHSSAEVQDDRDRNSLYETLENRVVPLYYQRGQDGNPTQWIKLMKRAIRTLGWRFSSDRMVRDYCESVYLSRVGGVSAEARQA
jgi:starch phosphorylase